MALPPPRDLAPRYDVKGGSPKTPVPPFSGSEYQQYVTTSNEIGNGVWKAIATGLGGLVVGLLVALFGAYQNKGVTQRELQEYVDKYSPVMPKDISAQISLLTEIKGNQQAMFNRLTTLETNERSDEKEVTEFKTETRKNNESWANFIEEQRKAKK